MSQRRRQGHRWIPWLGAVLLLAAIVYGLWPQPVPVETATAAVGPLRASVNEEGKTRIRQRYLVSAPVTGHVRRITLDPGDAVEAHQTVIAVIDPVSPTLLDARSRSLAEARRDAAAANLEKARAAHTFAASERDRFEKLFAEQAVSVQELDQARWRETAAARERAAAESALRQAEAELAEFNVASDSPGQASPSPVEVRAPASGRVLRVFEESARVTAAGASLVEIGDPTELEVVIEVLSRDAAVIAPGTRVELDHWGGPAPLQAKVRLIEPAAFTKVSALGVEEQRVNVVADLTTPPAERGNLGHNFRVEARIIVWESEATLKVPAGVLFRRGPDWAVYVLADGRARARRVQIGQSSGTETQILDGLEAGAEVILYPGDRVREGLRVRRITI